jgi:hypothetical protein
VEKLCRLMSCLTGKLDFIDGEGRWYVVKKSRPSSEESSTLVYHNKYSFPIVQVSYLEESGSEQQEVHDRFCYYQNESRSVGSRANLCRMCKLSRTMSSRMTRKVKVKVNGA